MDKSMANTILNKVIETGEQVSAMAQKLNHLYDTVDEHHDLIVETRNDVKTVVSKQNQDYTYFVKDREAMLKSLNSKIDPMWEEYEKKEKLVADVKGRTWNMAWDWAKMGVIFGAGYVLTTVYEMVSAFKK